LKVLAVVNQDDAGPGLFGEVVLASGAELVSWRPPLGEPAPEVPDAVMVLGGAMHPHQEAEHPWLRSQREWLRGLLSRDVPVLGVCLGAELLGQAAGGSVVELAAPEIGWQEARLTADAAGDPVFGSLPSEFPSLQWHSYAVEPPAGAPVLARTSASAQAYRLAPRAWGIQFHAEVTPHIVDGWIADAEATDAEDVREAGVDLGAMRERTAREIEAWGALGRGLCERFLAVAGQAGVA
jgi:GMP synthase-like glutamine amidotransferase